MGRKLDINLQMLKEWVKPARKYLSERCVSNIRSLENVAQGINDINENLVILLEELSDAKNSTK